MVVVAYGLILPQWVLDAFAGPGQWGCLNIHGSLLPRWRGAAPIHRAIEAGDSDTGVTIMQMDAGLDTGAMLIKQSLAIAPDDTTASLHDRLAALGAQLVVRALADPAQWQPAAQSEQGVTYAHKIDKSEAAIDWRQSSAQIARRVRAFNPFPGATAQLQGENLKVWGADMGTDDPLPGGSPGTVLRADAEGIAVQTGEGILNLRVLQRPGGKRLSAAEFLRGFTLTPGMAFDLPSAQVHD